VIPRIHTGGSFKGAGLYYLHDKLREGETERLTTARVAWTHALNTLENDPEAVLAEMRQTAFDQPYLKMVSGNRIDGRPTEKPVMTVALAWSPSENPQPKEMIEAGKSFLEHMGWQEHQCLVVGHNDTAHPHIHLILNRVHPETGMGIDDSWRTHRAHEWSLAYERERGQVLCLKRLDNEAMTRGEALRPREKAAHSRHYGEWHAAQDEQRKEGVFETPELTKAAEWDALKADQRTAREGFWKETGQLRRELGQAVTASVREEFAPDWKAYAAHKAEMAEKAKLYDREARRAIRHAMRLSGMPRGVTELKEGQDGKLHRQRRGAEPAMVRQIKERQKDYHARQQEELKALREGIQKDQRGRVDALKGHALDKLSEDRQAAYQQLLAGQRGDKGQLRADQHAGRPRIDLLARHYQQNVEPQRPPPAREARAGDANLLDLDQMQKRLAANARAVQQLNERALAPRDVSSYVAHARTRSAMEGNFRETTGEVAARSSEPARAEQQRRDAADRQWHDSRRAEAPAASGNEFTEAMQRRLARDNARPQRSRDSSSIERFDGHLSRGFERGERSRDDRGRDR
jgi:hypothetical protein